MKVAKGAGEALASVCGSISAKHRDDFDHRRDCRKPSSGADDEGVKSPEMDAT